MVPSFRRVLRRLPWWVSLIVIILVVLSQHYGWFDETVQQAQPTTPGSYHVRHVSDGDTIVIDMNGREETIRFIGVDTPETHDPRKAVQCYGFTAAAFTKEFIAEQNVRLESDPKNTDRDRYNRLLRYVYLPDGTLINAELIKRGYGFVYPSFPFTKQEDFTVLQTQAQISKLGLWSACQPTRSPSGVYTSNDE